MPDLVRIDEAQLVLPDAGILAGQLAPSSIAEYRKSVAAYLAWCQATGGHPLAAASLAQWRTHQAQTTTHSAATINRHLAAIKRLVAEGTEQGYIPADIAGQFARLRGVQAKALKDRQRPNARTRIEPKQMRALADAPDRTTLKGTRDAALIAVLAGSGLRAGEAARLTLGAMRRKDDGWVLDILGKGKSKTQEAPLTPEAHDLIMEWIAVRPVESTYVFTAFRGRGDSRALAAPMSATSIWRTVQEYAIRCKLEHIKPHDLRRFLGTELAKKNIRDAQLALRHDRIETTARHYILDELKAGVSDNLY